MTLSHGYWPYILTFNFKHPSILKCTFNLPRFHFGWNPRIRMRHEAWRYFDHIIMEEATALRRLLDDVQTISLFKSSRWVICQVSIKHITEPRKWKSWMRSMSYWNMVILIEFPYLLDGFRWYCVHQQPLFIGGTLPPWDSTRSCTESPFLLCTLIWETCKSWHNWKILVPFFLGGKKLNFGRFVAT